MGLDSSAVGCPLTLALSPKGRGDDLLPLPFRERAGVRVKIFITMTNMNSF
jgi:hypothetical protein